MTNPIACLCVVALTFTFVVADEPEDAKAVQGTWIPVKAELAGKPFPESILKAIQLKTHNGEYEVMVGEKLDKGTYTIDAAAAPKAMTIKGVDGPNAGKTFPAIYELKGDVLRVCYDLSGAKRPTEFATKEGTTLYLVTYNRKK